MTKVKLTNSFIIEAKEVEIKNGILNISTVENTVEELAEMFSNKDNTNLITFLTAADAESGFRVGFTSFIGIDYDADGVKTIKLAQPADTTESRISKAEGIANKALAQGENIMSTFSLLPEEIQAKMIENDINNLLLESEV